MRQLAVADCETDPFKIGRFPKPFVWGFFDGADYKQFPWHYARSKTPTEDFVAFLREQPIICYAHNGGRFDWHHILPYLNPYDEVMLINGRIAKAFIGLCELRDSYNILPVPLSAYKKDDIDYEIMEETERYKPENWETISRYLRSDCVYLYELIAKFVQQFGLQITQAAAAMAQWKKLSQRKLPQTNTEFYDKISPYYYGGRVECFRSGVIDTRFSVYDINSAYPFAMQHKHPYSPNFTEIEAYVDDADFYKVECVSKGAFPYRGLGGPDEFSGLRFPSDGERRTYTVTGWEYEIARKNNLMQSPNVLTSLLFDEHIDFGDYIKHFYDMRLEAIARKDDASSLFAKLLMNSLYGKFAANPETYKNNMIVPMDVIGGLEAEGWRFAGELGPWALAEQDLEESEMRYYNVATGGSITGFVRAMMLQGIVESHGVLYCDTDGLATEELGKDIKRGTALGEWKHEGTFDKAGIAGKKLYIFHDHQNKKRYKCATNPRVMCEFKHASKGARLTHADLWAVAKGAKVTWQSMVPTYSPRKSPFFTERVIQYTAAKSSLTKGKG